MLRAAKLRADAFKDRVFKRQRSFSTSDAGYCADSTDGHLSVNVPTCTRSHEDLRYFGINQEHVILDLFYRKRLNSTRYSGSNSAYSGSGRLRASDSHDSLYTPGRQDSGTGSMTTEETFTVEDHVYVPAEDPRDLGSTATQNIPGIYRSHERLHMHHIPHHGLRHPNHGLRHPNHGLRHPNQPEIVTSDAENSVGASHSPYLVTDDSLSTDTDSVNNRSRKSSVDVSDNCFSPAAVSAPTPIFNFDCEDLCYHVNRGYLLILVNINFHNTFMPRYGADSDIMEAKKFFGSVGFDIEEEYVDKTKVQMEEYLKRKSRDPALAKYDCFVAILSSHGNEDGVLGVDNDAYPVNEIVDLFKPGRCPLKKDAPRIFIVQACRGCKKDPGTEYLARGGGPTSALKRDGPSLYSDLGYGLGIKKLPTDANIIIAYATTEGKKAYNDVYAPFYDGPEQSGSWFMKCAMEVFKRYSEMEDLLTMFTRVNRAMLAYGDDERSKQISSQVSQLTYKVYFTPANR